MHPSLSRMNLKIISLAVIMLMGCRSTHNPLTKEWTIAEVQEWYNKKYSSWDGLLYRGSDKKMHHFVSRVRDEWYFFNIKKSLLTLPEEMPMPLTELVRK